jgi:hypothetical protein
MKHPRRSTQIRAQREAKDIARYFGFGTPLPEEDEDSAQEQEEQPLVHSASAVLPLTTTSKDF